jgi:hypothetical protein
MVKDGYLIGISKNAIHIMLNRPFRCCSTGTTVSLAKAFWRLGDISRSSRRRCLVARKAIRIYEWREGPRVHSTLNSYSRPPARRSLKRHCTEDPD